MIVPIQPFGLGDIILCQTLAHSFNNKVLWPVMPQFVDGLNRAYPDVTFVNKDLFKIDYDRKEDYSIGDMRMLPIRWGDEFAKIPYRTGWMKGKYMMYNQDWEKWQDKAMWKRDIEREQKLFDALGLKVNAPYNLINRYFRSDNSGIADVSYDSTLPTIEMQSYKGFSLFDWYLVIQNATNIHTVSTAIIYIIEMLEIHAKEVNLYLRKGEETDFTNVDYLLKNHKYNLIY